MTRVSYSSSTFERERSENTDERGMARRYKRATAPLDETARARLWTESSGGESPMPFSSSDSDELADLVDSFYHEAGDERDDSGSQTRGSIACSDQRESLEAVLAEWEDDSVARRIRVEAERAVRAVGPQGDAVKKRVMACLREEGFDAGLCESRWEKTHRISAGSHEYIDVIDGSGSRYIVEINFGAEFEIARPSDDYAALVGALLSSSVFVGKLGTVERVVGLMCAAMKKSMKRSGMHRRKEYVQAKWLSSSYERSCEGGIEKEAEREDGTERGPATPPKKLCRIELQCRDVQVRRGMLAMELRGF